jgi:hypothetical protein
MEPNGNNAEGRTILTAAEVQQRVQQRLRFDTLKDPECKGMECLIRKITKHRALNQSPLYQSYMLQSFLRGPVQAAGVPTTLGFARCVCVYVFFSTSKYHW